MKPTSPTKDRSAFGGKKILLYTRPLTPPWDEASKNLAWDLVQNIKDDFEFHILTTHKFANEISDQNIIAHPIFSQNKFNFTAKLKMLLWFFFSKLDFDIIHFPFTPRSLTSFLIRLRLKFFKGKTIQSIAATKKINNKICFADKIVTQSKNTKEKLQKAGIKNIQTIYPGVDLNLYRPMEKDSRLIKELSLKGSDLPVVFAGEYTKIKGVDNVIESFILLNKQSKIENLKLILAVRIKNQADIAKKQKLVELVEKEGLADKIIFMADHREKLMKKMGKFMNKLYNLSAINIFPVSEMTGKFDIPYVIIEAMACGKPMIISDLPVLQEHITNEENGLVVPKNNPSALANAISNLARDEEKRLNLGQAGMNYAKENFDIKKTAAKYTTLYASL